MPLLAATLTDDPRLVAGLATTYALVRLGVALPVGVWVDRIDRRALMVVANLMRGVVVIMLAVFVQLGVGGLAFLYVAFAVVGTLESAADDAAVALVPSLVEPGDLDRANGRISAAQLVADEFAGPPAGGWLFALAAAAPFFAMGGLWAVAGMIAVALPARAHTGGMDARVPTRRSMVREAADGARWLARNRLVGGLAVIGALASVGYMMAFSILVLFAQERLGVGGFGYGLILAVSALGGLLGSFTTAWLRARMGYRWTIVVSLLTGAGSLFALSTATSGLVASALLAVYIFHAVVWGICATSLRQRLVPDPFRGRVNAAARVLGLLGLAIGSALGGVLAVVDLALPVAIGGAVFLVCALAAVIVVRPGDGEAGIAGWTNTAQASDHYRD